MLQIRHSRKSTKIILIKMTEKWNQMHWAKTDTQYYDIKIHFGNRDEDKINWFSMSYGLILNKKAIGDTEERN